MSSLTEKHKLYDQMVNCSKCKSNNNIFVQPFCFEMKNQPIMIITACPSLQVIYKQITSVRFFRKLTYFLFGTDGCSENIIKEFNDGSIYWTHYHKCYFSKGDEETRLKHLPNICSNKFLDNELKALKEDLKIIIVIGKVIENDIKARIKRAGLDHVIVKYVEFPDLDTEKDVVFELKDELIKLLKYKPRHREQNFNKSNFNESYNTPNAIHMDFEYELLKRLSSQGNIIESNSMNELWYNDVIVPMQRRYLFIIESYLYIESQIKTFLFSRVSDKTLLEAAGKLDRNESRIYTREVTIDLIQKKWYRLFEKYREELFSKTKRIDPHNSKRNFNDKFCEFRDIRNLVVHSNGFIRSDGKYSNNFGKLKTMKIERFNKVFIFVNLLFVSREAEVQVLDFINEVNNRIKKTEEIKLRK